MSDSPRRAAVVGHPVGHSLSPVMHRAAYAALGLARWAYDAVDVDEHELGDFLESLDASWAGLSVTMPLKRAVRGFLVEESDLAAQVGAVNTVVLDEHGRHGYNTDVYGIIHALGELGVTQVSRALVLGGGATAASALAALRDLGCLTPVVLARSPGRCGPLLEAAQRLGVGPRIAVLDDAGLAAEARVTSSADSVVISTLPVGGVDAFVDVLVQSALGEPDPSHPHGPALLDVLYDPWPTALATAWSAAGGRAVGGFSMLVHQAEGQVRLMTGRRPALDVMRAAGQAELDRRTERTQRAPTSEPARATPSG